ncbi:MAG: hypothetical protein HOW73_11645 [Polyangiaceae bacterium]|nr:hypothetical protein [Polyangiaceae bacterium]
MKPFVRRGIALVAWMLACGAACGARTGLPGAEGEGGGTAGSGGRGGSGAGGSGGEGGEGGEGGVAPPCTEGETEVCGTDVGECSPGVRTCHNGVFGFCVGAVEPLDEQCNALDDDCDGAIDEDFGIGQACDGPDSDACLDDVMTCAGCTFGDDLVEVCNGVDDNCNGEVDSDCEVGDCEPTLLVTGSTPSNPNCKDFPVEAGSTGSIEYPCDGGPVTATLGTVQFTGDVQNGFLSLEGIVDLVGPDGCNWRTIHHINGFIPNGALSYSYSEVLLDQPPPIFCWSPCTETGDVDIQWLLER